MNVTNVPNEHWSVVDVAFDNYPSTAGLLMQLTVVVNGTYYKAVSRLLCFFGNETTCAD